MARLRLPCSPGADAISLVVSLLRPVLEGAALRQQLGAPKYGLIHISTHCEAGVFFHYGLTEGAGLMLTCQTMTSEVTLTVRRSSVLLRSLAWSVLGVSVLAGARLAPRSSMGAGLAVGTLGGVALAVWAIFSLQRSGVAARGRSDTFARQLDDAVRPWVEAQGGTRKS